MTKRTHVDQRQFDFEAALLERDKAVEHVESGVGTDWLHEAMLAVRRVAQAQMTFTTDDLWTLIDPPREPRAMGATMTHARRLGLCEPTDRTSRSSRVACHARPLRVWRSLIFKEPT